MAADYYNLLIRSVRQLPSNTREARRNVYKRARIALAEQTDSSSEYEALERAIHSVEQEQGGVPNGVGTRGPTWLLALSTLFAGLWMMDATSMSVYWVVRPWYGPNRSSKKRDVKRTRAGMDKSDRFFGIKLDARRLALSLSITGAILVPLATGSLMRFIRQPIIPAGASYTMETDPRETPEATDTSLRCAFDMTSSGSKRNPKTNLPDTDACNSRLPWYPPVKVFHPYPASLNVSLAIFLIRDLLLGTLIPAFLILVVPRIGQRYWRWLTS